MLQLPVPYRSQFDGDARRYGPDCGPACLAMVLNYLGIEATTDDLYDETIFEEPQKWTKIYELRNAAANKGVAFPIQTYGHDRESALNILRANLDAGRPLIALVKYAPWRHLTGHSFGGGHFVVVTGYDDEQISVHDPYFSGPRRELGEHFTMSIDNFCRGWAGFTTEDQTSNWAFLAPGVGGEVSDAQRVAELTVPPVSFHERRRIRAFAVYHGDEPPELTDEAEVAAWLESVGEWGDDYEPITVQSGDSLYGLAARHYDNGTLWPVIQAYNDLERDWVILGETLHIPQIHQGVRPGRRAAVDFGDYGEADMDLGAQVEEAAAPAFAG